MNAQLKNFELRDSQVTDTGLVHLKGLTKLDSLHVPELVTDAGLVHLVELPNLHAQGDHMKWVLFYLLATVIGAILGGIPAIYYVDDIWRQKPIQGGFEFMKWVATAIVLLAVPVGAMCGTGLAALTHVIYAIYFYFCHRSAPSRRMSLSDEERRAFEKELKQAEAEGKEVWTRK